MKIKKIPMYFYQGGVQKGNGTITMLMDNAIIERYKQYTETTTLYEWSDQHWASGGAQIVNKYLGFYLLNPAITYYYGVDGTNPLNPSQIMHQKQDMIGLTQISPVTGLTEAATPHVANVDIKLLNNVTTTEALQYIRVEGSPPIAVANSNYNLRYHFNNYVYEGNKSADFQLFIFDENLYKSDGSYDAEHSGALQFDIRFTFSNDLSEITGARIRVRYSNFGSNYSWINLSGAQDTDTDGDNPFDPSGDPSGEGGGDGDQTDPNSTQPVDVPDVPSISAASVGLINLYTPTEAQLVSLANFLWAGAFDPAQFKKLFNDPMQAIIGLGIVPILPSSAGTKNIRLGNVDSGVNCSYVGTNFVKKDCGSVKIKTQAGSFMDYDPYVKINLYLPFIGFRTLSADDIMGGSINVQYIVDILTGACCAFVKHSTRGVLYSYNGSCITNVALSGANYSQAIQNAVSTVASGVGVIAGIASGAAPVTAMSAISMLGSAANTALNSKGQIQRSGNMGGSAGMIGVKKPFVVIERQRYSVPNYVQKYVGQMSNITASLGSCSGFTMVEYCHIEGVTGTVEEVNEIESLLKQGVIL
jgi:hypothetical protein